MKQKRKKLKLNKQSKPYIIQNATCIETTDGFEIHFTDGRFIRQDETKNIDFENCCDDCFDDYSSFRLLKDPALIIYFIGRGRSRALLSISYGAQSYDVEDIVVNEVLIGRKPEPVPVPVSNIKAERPWFLDSAVLMGTSKYSS